MLIKPKTLKVATMMATTMMMMMIMMFEREPGERSWLGRGRGGGGSTENSNQLLESANLVAMRMMMLVRTVVNMMVVKSHLGVGGARHLTSDRTRGSKKAARWL